eukprot:GHVS01053606.1.p1 GENE.GHVS01053606.1~~GHVS01053606.1.p1  ORF type:complete len:489 (-),score=55.26 GHVS01053606.1:215-1681(-)
MGGMDLLPFASCLLLALWACGFTDMLRQVIWLMGAPLLCAAQDTMGLLNSQRDFSRRYAFVGFEDAGFYSFAAADSNFFQQIRCRTTGNVCSVHAQCCAAFCNQGLCRNMQSFKRSSLWGGRYLLERLQSRRTSRLREFAYNRAAPDDTSLALGAHRQSRATDIEYPNEGDNQLRQAINAAFGEFFQEEEVYESCWSSFLEKKFIPPAFPPSTSSATCAAVADPYPSRSEATGTFRRAFEEEAIYFGTFAEVPPFSYFVSPDKREYWGFDAEVVRQVIGFFNRRYGSDVKVKTSFIPAQLGLFNNAADALYNGQVDIFFGKFELNPDRCAIVGCGCPYYNTGNLVLVGGIKELHGNPLDVRTEWNDAGVTIGVLEDDVHIAEIVRLFPNVTLRLFWSFWDLGEHLIQGNIHAALTHMSVARFMQTMYDIYCPECFMAKIFEPNDHMLGWAFRQFPAPPVLRQVDSASFDAVAPLPRVYPIDKHTLPIA